jgi:hypothetical protein
MPQWDMEMSREVLKMRKYIYAIVCMMTVFIYSLPAEAVYDTWAYKIEITVNNPGSATTDYPVLVNIPAKTFIDAGRMNSDLRDIRFSDGTNALPFWIKITESMQRYINNIPVYVKLKNFNAGNNIIYMSYDKSKSKTDSPPKVDYTVGVAADYCGDFGSPASPYSALTCGKNVFGLSGTSAVTGMFSYDCSDSTANGWSADSNCIGNTNTRWVSKNKFGITSNAFDLYYRLHYYNGDSMTVYFLTQNTSAPTVTSIDNYCGYKLYVNGSAASSTANQTYNMGNVVLTLQKKTTNCGSSSTGWATVSAGTYNWHPYDNSIQDFDIRVTSAAINTYINGNSMGTYTRGADGWTGGYVGFNRGSFTGSAEYGSNSTDGISPIWVVNNYVGLSSGTFYGNTDITMKRIKPTSDASYIGQDIIETYPQKQVLEDYVDGNTLEKYVYSAFPLASLETQVFKYSMTIRNRGSAQDTFDILLTPTGDTSSWSIAFDNHDGLGYVFNLPNGNATTGNVTISAGSAQIIDILVMPSSTALFEGGKGSDNLLLDVKATSRRDFSFDDVRFVAYLRGKSGCYWKWQMPITVSYNDVNVTGDIRDYQVLVNLTGVTQLTDARSDGADILFTDSQGTKLPFYMKSLNRTAGTASFWVKMPKVSSGSPGRTTIYIWWGNANYSASLSDPKKTFDLWEDWTKKDATHFWTLNQVIGCQDGTTDCTGIPNDPYDVNNWRNSASPANNYDWWRIRTRLDGQAVMADKGSGNVSSDIGPILSGGDIRWTNYEVSYSFYDEYDNYNTGAGNPQYNPVYFQDAGNAWGMEFYATSPNLFIFRPVGSGCDWTWTYQANAGAMLGSTFPAKNKRFWIKTKLFQNPADTKTHLKLFVAPSTPADTDSDSSPFVEITPTTPLTNGITPGFIADPAFTINGGMIGLGGWNGGFSFDNIRVRKYTEPEPACTQGSATQSLYTPVSTLSSPVLTPPLMNGRPVLLSAILTPWSWTGNLVALYADCFIGGDCKSGEDPTKTGTISLWGKVDDNTPAGFGNQLEVAYAKDYNRSSINDISWQADGRYIFTAYNSSGGTGAIGSCSSTTSGNCMSFELTTDATKIATLKSLMGVSTDTDFQNLIRFVRGEYVSGYSRSDSRNYCSSGTTDTCQWKLGDIIHSNPLVVGIPNMVYADPDYSVFENNLNSRDLVAYFSSNEGIVHAVRMASYDPVAKMYTADNTATELWGFIPNAVLPMLNRTTDLLHEYTTDGLFRAIDIKTGGVYKTVLIGGLRSGGQSLFAMDITDPRSPQLMWEINAGQSANAAAFSNIGKTWSAPAIGRLCETNPCDYTSSSNRWVAIIGSGFAPNDITNLSKNAYLSVINLETGSVIKQIEISNKFGNVTTNLALLRDKNGYIVKVFFGDYYGALWRIDLSTASNVTAFMAKTVLSSSDMLFQPADYSTSNINTIGAGPQRPITAMPRIAYAGNNIFWVYFGTGVYNEYNASYPYQRVYGLIDTATTYTDLSLVDMTLSTTSNSGSQSWFLELGHTDSTDVAFSGTLASCITSCTNQGNSSDYCNSICKTTTSSVKDRNERVLNSPEVYGGFIFFGTYTPSNVPCGEGTSRFYALSYKTGQYSSGLMLNATSPLVRSVVVSTGKGIPSNPLIFVGRSGQGQVVAAGLIDISTGQLIKIMLNPNMFTDVVSILLWREIR